MRLSAAIAAVGFAATVFSAGITLPITRGTRGPKNPAGNTAQRIKQITQRLAGFKPVSVSAPSSGSAEQLNQENFSYLVNVTLSDGIERYIDLDTGSSDVWVRAANCESPTGDSSCNYTVGPDAVDPNAFIATQLPYSYLDTYGLGASAGFVAVSNVTVGGLTATIPIGISQIELQQQQGLLGLAFSALSSLSNTVGYYSGYECNWFDALKLSDPVFGFYLSNYNDGDDGEVTFGGYDATKYSGEPAWFPLVNATTDARGVPSPGWWTFSTEGWSWSITSNNATAHGSLYSANSQAIADTGTSYLILPPDVVSSIFAVINATFDSDPEIQSYVIPCNNTLPPIVLNFNGTDFAIPSDIYTIFAGTTSAGVNICVPGLGSLSDAPLIFGDTFLRAFYSFYDKKNLRVGFAPAVHPATTTSSASTATTASTATVSGVISTSSTGTVAITGSSLPTTIASAASSAYVAPKVESQSGSGFYVSGGLPTFSTVFTGVFAAGAAILIV
ncbi:hypothetical protein HK100_003651 [Physocladia obscura]|uniref:Peptidase A1 domain-containing protein n=1 Tax=Physocladia obscura TaxID=109957 RepID=A0AAD5XDF3_9FUNG|nr:hypothetical protein HK100_003651 [Physocladia obscura]